MASMTLSLFKDINPNSKGNIHYIFDDPALFYSTCLIKHLITTKNDGDFRINRGTIAVSASSEEYVNYRKATYALLRITRESGAQPVMIFYHVDKVRFECGKAYIDVHEDEFANGMMNASMSDILVSRSSRGNLDVLFGVSRLTYDGTFMPYGTYEYTDSESNQYYNEMAVVAKIDMVVSTDGFANNPITRSVYIVADAYQLVVKYNSMNKTPTDWLTKIQDMMGGIYEGATYSSDAGQRQQMKCSAIYVVPVHWLTSINYMKLDDTTYTDVSMKTRSGLTGYEGSIIGHTLLPSHYEFTTNYTAGRSAPSYNMYYGTRGQWMELPRKYLFGDVGFVCDASTGGLLIKAKQGSNEVDMTNAFALPCSFANDIDTETTQVQKGIVNGLSIFQSIFKAGKKGDALGAGLGAYKSVAELMNNNNAKSNGTDGNAFMTYLPLRGENETTDDYFTRLQTKWIINPFVEAYVRDIADADGYVRTNGISTSDTYDDKSFLATIAGYEYLGPEGTTSPADTFIRCTMSVQGVPEGERKAIENAFKDGIRYVYVTVE